MELKEIKIEDILVNKNQPRKYFNDRKFVELRESIKNNGLIQPIGVRPIGENGKYEIVVGERRFRACLSLGYETILATVHKLDDKKSYEYAVLENIQRDNLNPIEEAESYVVLIQKYGYTQESLADKLGKTRSSVSNKIRLLNLPEEVKKLLREKKLSYGQARTIVSLGIKEEQIKLAEETLKNGYSVRVLEEIVREKNSKDNYVTLFDDLEKKIDDSQKYAKLQKIAKKIQLNKERNNFFRITTEEKEKIENILCSHIGVKVTLKEEKNGGSLEIKFNDRDDLVNILDFMGFDII